MNYSVLKGYVPGHGHVQDANLRKVVWWGGVRWSPVESGGVRWGGGNPGEKTGEFREKSREIIPTNTFLIIIFNIIILITIFCFFEKLRNPNPFLGTPQLLFCS